MVLDHKPGAALHLSTFFPASSARGPYADTLVVFLNGLALPSLSWIPAVERLISQRHEEAGLPLPALLCYDRYGQGESDPDPTDPPGTPYGHDLSAAAEDLHALLTRVCRDYLDREPDDTRLVLVCNSIGCALARLYAGAHPGRVEGLLFLDSMMANTDFVSLFPDPDAATWGPDDEASLPPGVSPEDLRHARAEIAKIFHPTVPNGERLDRRYLPQLLPRADAPALPPGPSGKMPLLTVVGHDWDTFAEENEQVGPLFSLN